MTKAIEFEIGEVKLALRWSKRAEYRLSAAGFAPGTFDPHRAVAQLFAMLAACNEAPGTKHLSGEDLYAAQPDYEDEDEAAEFVGRLADVATRVVESGARPGKRKRLSKKSGRSRGDGSG